MKEIQLSQGKVALVDDEDFEKVRYIKWCYNNGYAKTHKFKMHRFILNITDPDIIIDHINHNTLDNRKENLRICTQTLNKKNRNKQNSFSKYKGVYFEKTTKKWKAQIQNNNKKMNLGRYDTQEDAARIYDVAAVKYFGEFAMLNFPIKEKGE